MFLLNVLNDDVSSILVVKGNTHANICHLRFGHLNFQGLQLVGRKNMVVGMPKISTSEFCEGCMYGKQNKPSFPVGNAWRASTCLELVHADLCSPMSTKSLVGSQHFLLFVDDYSRMIGFIF